MAVQPDAACQGESPRQPDFLFLVIPGEGDAIREARWNKVLCNLQRSGKTILGTGPDLDWPVRYELADESNPFGPFYDVFEVVTLEERERLTETQDDTEEAS